MEQPHIWYSRFVSEMLSSNRKELRLLLGEICGCFGCPEVPEIGSTARHSPGVPLQHCKNISAHVQSILTESSLHARLLVTSRPAFAACWDLPNQP